MTYRHRVTLAALPWNASFLWPSFPVMASVNVCVLLFEVRYFAVLLL